MGSCFQLDRCERIVFGRSFLCFRRMAEIPIFVETCRFDDRSVLPTHRFRSPAKMASFRGLLFFTVPYAKPDSSRSVWENPLLEFDKSSKNEAHAMFPTYKTKGFRASGAKTAADERVKTALEISRNATNLSTVPRLRTPKSTRAGLPTVALCFRNI